MYTGNELCDLCIDIMAWWANNTPLSYGAINVLLFVILQPLLILLFFTTTIVAVRSRSDRVKSAIKVSSIVLMAILIVGVLILLGLPLFDIFTNMHMESDMTM